MIYTIEKRLFPPERKRVCWQITCFVIFGLPSLSAAGCAAPLQPVATVVKQQQTDEQQQTEWKSVTSDELYEVSIAPENGRIEIGPLHNWVINVKAPDKGFVFPARIVVGGGMSAHGHGLPTQPQVTSYGGGGDYLVEGVRFNMAGAWKLVFVIEAESGRDIAEFVIDVDY